MSVNCRIEKTVVKLESIEKIIEYHVPSFQRLLDKDYVEYLCEDQINEYNKYGAISALQSITCALFNDKMYILDGQHRIEMFRRLKEKNVNLSKSIIPVIIYNIDTKEELKEYYNRINKHHPINPLQLDENWVSNKYFFEWFPEKFKIYIKKTNLCKCPHFNMDNMMNHFKQFDILKKIPNVTTFINCVESFNTYLVNNRETIKNNQVLKDLSNNFNKCYSKCPDNPCMLGIWRHYEWVDHCLNIIENNNMDFSQINLGTFSRQRPKISQELKIQVWNKRNDDITKGQCYCCEDDIKLSNVECGHVVPHCRGGSATIHNLEPICKKCNNQMGIMNLS